VSPFSSEVERIYVSVVLQNESSMRIDEEFIDRKKFQS
jgi:hypothetical protein